MLFSSLFLFLQRSRVKKKMLLLGSSKGVSTLFLCSLASLESLTENFKLDPTHWFQLHFRSRRVMRVVAAGLFFHMLMNLLAIHAYNNDSNAEDEDVTLGWSTHPSLLADLSVCLSV